MPCTRARPTATSGGNWRKARVERDDGFGIWGAKASHSRDIEKKRDETAHPR